MLICPGRYNKKAALVESQSISSSFLAPTRGTVQNLYVGSGVKFSAFKNPSKGILPASNDNLAKYNPKFGVIQRRVKFKNLKINPEA